MFHFFREEGWFTSTFICYTLDGTLVVTMLVGIPVKVLISNYLFLQSGANSAGEFQPKYHQIK